MTKVYRGYKIVLEGAAYAIYQLGKLLAVRESLEKALSWVDSQEGKEY